MDLKERSPDVLARRREKMIKYLRLASYGDGYSITCDDCDARSRCQYSFDVYNTDGSCLAMK